MSDKSKPDATDRSLQAAEIEYKELCAIFGQMRVQLDTLNARYEQCRRSIISASDEIEMLKKVPSA